MMDKHTIISLKDQGKSIREIARTTGFARKTVSRHWERYQEQLAGLGSDGDLRKAQEAIIEKPRYDPSFKGAGEIHS